MPLYSSRGFNAFYLGDEAVIDCRRFGLEGPGRKGLRAAVRRVGRTHRFRLVAEADAPPALVDQLNAISARWRGKHPERDRKSTRLNSSHANISYAVFC